VVFPWIPFLFGRRKRLSDIEFLSIKEFDGKLVTDEGGRTTVGDIATLTANSGKDLYLAKAKVSIFFQTTDNIPRTFTIDLKVNGVTKATWTHEALNSVQAGSERTTDLNGQYEFPIIGLKVAATQIIKLELITIDTAGGVEGQLICFEETTGESPQIG